MKRRFVIIVLFVFVCISFTQAGDVKFIASARKVVEVGEQFQLIYTFNGRDGKVNMPQLKGFSLLGGPNVGYNSSFQNNNGKVTQSISTSYTYILKAKSTGKFTIPPATLIIDRKKYRSNSLTIEVVKGSSGNKNQQHQKSGESKTTAVSSKELFAKTIISKTKVYQGEAIAVTQKIYSKYQIADISNFSQPSFTGFWTEDIDIGRLAVEVEAYNNEKYYVLVLKKSIIYPQKSGIIEIDPMKIECVIQRVKTRKARSRAEQMWYGSTIKYTENELHKLKSRKIIIKVAALPSEGKTSDFSGAVGSFKLTSSLTKEELNANEATNLKIVISGKGNLKLIEEPDIEFPPDFEVYDPKITNNIKTNESGMSGSKTFDYLIIPRNAGRYKIKPVVFTYFDVNNKAYKKLLSTKYELRVGKSDGSESNITVSNIDQEDIKYIGSDIRHIANHSFVLQNTGTFFFSSPLYFFLLHIPLLIFVLIIIIWRHRIKQRDNILVLKNKKATKVAKKRLKKAQEFLKSNNKDDFYIEISLALWGYLSDKFSIPLASLSIDSVTGALISKGVEKSIIEEFIKVLNNCEFARFAPGDSTSAMESIYSDGISIISKMERELK